MPSKKSRTIKLTDEAVKAIKSGMDEFEEVFGRKPDNDDPISIEQLIFSADAIVKQVSDDFYEAEITTAAETYAFKKLKYYVSEENKKHVTKQEIKDWDYAKKEFELIQKGEYKHPKSNIWDCILALEDENLKLIYLYSLLLWKQSSVTKEINLLKKINIKDYALFCITKNLKSLKASQSLIGNGFAEDGLVILRSIYENYLQLSYANNKPDVLLKELQFKVGLYLGTHKREKDKVIFLETGEIFTPLNNKQKSSLNTKFQNEDSNLYYIIYENFSSFTHPDIKTAFNYTDNATFNHQKDDLKGIATLFTSIINVMVLYEIYKLSLFGQTSQRDIIFFIKSHGAITLEYFKNIKLDKSSELNHLKSRVEKTLKYCR